MSVVTTSRKPCEDRMVEEVWWAVNSESQTDDSPLISLFLGQYRESLKNDVKVSGTTRPNSYSEALVCISAQLAAFPHPWGFQG